MIGVSIGLSQIVFLTLKMSLTIIISMYSHWFRFKKKRKKKRTRAELTLPRSCIVEPMSVGPWVWPSG